MVGLKAVEIQKGTKEIGDGEREPAFKMGNENHPLAGLRGGGKLFAGSAADHLGADPA